MTQKDFTPEIQEELKKELSIAFNVPVFSIGISWGAYDWKWGRRLLDENLVVRVIISSSVYPVRLVAACQEIPCTENITLNLNTSIFATVYVSQHVCEKCLNANFLQFASSGERDNVKSCRTQCVQGHFRLFDLDTDICRPHAVPRCPLGQWLRNGTHVRDARCESCSGCEGRRLVANCSTYANDGCGDCGVANERQRWVGIACKPVCDDGFVWDVLRKECDFCGTYVWAAGSWRRDSIRCPPGFQTPVEPDNCSHCVPCSGLPENATWSAQDDREDCVWLCKDEYQLEETASGEECVIRKTVELVHSIQEIKPVCAPGTIPLNFLCTPCFDVALVEGAEVQFSDLPQAHEEGIRWEWLYGCRWQCLHADDLWEMRAASGSYWE